MAQIIELPTRARKEPIAKNGKVLPRRLHNRALRSEITHTVRYGELAPDRFKGFWKIIGGQQQHLGCRSCELSVAAENGSAVKACAVALDERSFR